MVLSSNLCVVLTLPVLTYYTYAPLRVVITP